MLNGNNTIKTKVLYFPIIIFEVYLNFGLLLFFFGPFEYGGIRHPVLLPCYLIASHLLLFSGYYLAMRSTHRAYTGLFPVSWLIIYSIVSVFIASFIDYMSIADSVTGIPNAVLEGAQNLSQAYHSKFDIERKQKVFRYAIWFLIGSMLFLPLLVAYWKRLPLVAKIISVLAKCWELGTWIAIGTTKGIADTFVLLPILIACGYPNLIIIKRSVKKVVIYGLITIISISLVVSFFISAKYGNLETASLDNLELRNSFYYKLPPWFGAPLTLLISYMTQGYHGLDLCFSQPFVWAHGGGHSQGFLGNIIEDGQGNSALSLSYPGRVGLTEDWETYGRWHSIYPWIASDLTFPGTLVFVFILGYIYGLTWGDWLKMHNPLAFVVFYQLCIILLYFPCNNQVLGNMSVLGFIVWVAIWLFTRDKRAAVPAV